MDLRITFDKNINYMNLNLKSNIPLLDKISVMEIKTDIGIRDEYIEYLLSNTNERFSKYSRGIKITKQI